MYLRWVLFAAAPRSRQQTAHKVAELIRRSGGYRWVGLYDMRDSEVSAFAWTGSRAPAHPRFASSSGITGRAIRTRSAVIVNDVRSDGDYLNTFSSTQSEMIVPIHDGCAVVGTIDVESDRPNAFSEEDRRLIEECARIARPIWSAKWE